jgi:hypothetical protein
VLSLFGLDMRSCEGANVTGVADGQRVHTRADVPADRSNYANFRLKPPGRFHRQVAVGKGGRQFRGGSVDDVHPAAA